jgi:superfamily II DNA or RNA helicase
MDNQIATQESGKAGTWLWSASHATQCQVIEWMRLWGSETCRVWLPQTSAIVQVPASDLTPLGDDHLAGQSLAQERERLAYLITAAKIANLMTEDILLAPIDSAVIPLPHQLHALRRVVTADHVRFLLADEVGLGKTIEAGLVMRELKLRGLVRRTLVLAPRGLVTQWIAEMDTHFNEEFRHYSPSDFAAYRQIAKEDNVWRSYDQVICSLDSVKPLDSRKGWSDERLAAYNRDRYVDLISAGWDLVICDEAHRLGGSTEQVARHKLGQGLAEAAPYVLFLSATPHQGKTDAFHRIMKLLDATAFPDEESVTRERVFPYVVRTEKRNAIDADGKQLFMPRNTRLVPIPWKDTHTRQRLLYEAVTEYVREGYNQAMKQKKGYLGFLMILMQRLVTSSTRAIIATLERRREVLAEPSEQLSLFPTVLEEEWEDLDGQQQVESFLQSRVKAMQDERHQVDLLLDAARQVEAAGPDAKTEALLDSIYTLQKDEGDSDLKVLIFTEFVPTQAMLAEFLSSRGFSVTCLHGSMDMDARRRVQEQFASDVRILISTDAGGEGLNLQFCNVVINYDIPWNPMRLEQRIGRVDRIGQTKVVRAMNFILEDTIEFRVREVLEAKLAVILDEFGVDKTSDVLDSAEAGAMFDNLYVDALLQPTSVDDAVQRTLAALRSEASRAKSHTVLFDDTDRLTSDAARNARDFPLHQWIEAMTLNYLDANGGSYGLDRGVLSVRWPGTADTESECFCASTQFSDITHPRLSLDHPRVRGMISALPRYVPGQPVLNTTLSDIPPNIQGYWSLWQIVMRTTERKDTRIMPLFLHDDGRILQPTARFLWDQLNSQGLNATGNPGDPDRAFSATIMSELQSAAEAQGKETYDELRTAHANRLKLEREKMEHSFKARMRLLRQVGLEEVREYRLRQLAREEADWRDRMARQEDVLPELIPILVLRIN